MLIDGRLWLLIGLSIAMLFTIEAIEDFTDGAWPQMRRPSGYFEAVGSSRTLWMAVAMLVLPGLVLTILNLAVLVWKDLPYGNTLVIGTIFIIVGWLLFLATTIDLGGIGLFLERSGAVAPLALLVVLIAGDLLLLIAFIQIFPKDFSSLIP
ncbi:MAG TPA: hypothetical protein VF201_14955 [Nitrolancea sp.]